MKRTTQSGNDNNRYTTGNPVAGIPATVVGAAEMNHLQEELASTVEAAGLTLDDNDENQLIKALNVLIPNGGSTVTTFTVANDVSASTDVTGMLVDNSTYRTTVFNYFIRRKDDAEIRLEEGELSLIWDDVSSLWLISQQTRHGDSQVQFTVLASGQVQYTSDNMTGGNYEGQMKFSIKSRLAI